MEQAVLILFLSFLELILASSLPEPLVVPIQSPAGPESGEANLAVDDQGKVYLTWLEKDAGHHALKFATLESKSWSSPQTIHEGDDFFVNWADFPSLIAAGTR